MDTFVRGRVNEPHAIWMNCAGRLAPGDCDRLAAHGSRGARKPASMLGFVDDSRAPHLGGAGLALRLAYAGASRRSQHGE